MKWGSKMGAIVRVLWGINELGCRLEKVVRQDVCRRMLEPGSKEYVYVYGVKNTELFTSNDRYCVRLINYNPFPDRCHDVRIRPNRRSMKRPWHYKWELLQRAVEEHGEIIYCDWDVRSLTEDADEAFSLLAGRNLTLSAYRYLVKSHAPDRATQAARKIVASGNWIHLRGMEFVDRVLAEMDWNHPKLWHDEVAIGSLLDKEYGGWMGDTTWLQQYESPIMVQRSKRVPWEFVRNDGQKIIRDTPVPFHWIKLFTAWSNRKMKMRSNGNE